MKIKIRLESNNSPHGRYISEIERGEGGVGNYYDVVDDEGKKVATLATHAAGSCCITTRDEDEKFNRIDLPKGSFEFEID